MDWTDYKAELDAVEVPERTVAALYRRAEMQPQEGGRRTWRRAALIAAAVCLLTVFSCAVAWKGWLDPVVPYGGNGELIEEYSVQVGQTAEGKHCDLTLENVVTDGKVIYCLFTARYDSAFPDMDYALEYMGVLGTTGAGVMGYWRLDNGEKQGEARFVYVTGLVMEDAPLWYPNTPFLGKEIDLNAYFLDDAATGIMERVEDYHFTVQMNDTIPTREKTWPDGTRVRATPILLELFFDQEMPDWYDQQACDAFEQRQECTVEFSDGSRFTLNDALETSIQGCPPERFGYGWESTPDGTAQDPHAFHMWMLFPELTDPAAITAVTINGERYELS